MAIGAENVPAQLNRHFQMKSISSSSGGRLRFMVRLTPRASRNEVVGWMDSGELKVRIAAPPVDEAANMEFVRFLSKVLSVRKSDIDIVTGTHSRLKQIEVPGECKNRLLSFEDI